MEAPRDLSSHCCTCCTSSRQGGKQQQCSSNNPGIGTLAHQPPWMQAEADGHCILALAMHSQHPLGRSVRPLQHPSLASSTSSPNSPQQTTCYFRVAGSSAEHASHSEGGFMGLAERHKPGQTPAAPPLQQRRCSAAALLATATAPVAPQPPRAEDPACCHTWQTVRAYSMQCRHLLAADWCCVTACRWSSGAYPCATGSAPCMAYCIPPALVACRQACPAMTVLCAAETPDRDATNQAHAAAAAVAA